MAATRETRERAASIVKRILTDILLEIIDMIYLRYYLKKSLFGRN